MALAPDCPIPGYPDLGDAASKQSDSSTRLVDEVSPRSELVVCGMQLPPAPCGLRCACIVASSLLHVPFRWCNESRASITPGGLPGWSTVASRPLRPAIRRISANPFRPCAGWARRRLDGHLLLRADALVERLCVSSLRDCERGDHRAP